jgi:HKD family nuclease
MRMACLTSSALDSLAKVAHELSCQATELWIATAFVSESAFSDVTQPLSESNRGVRFLTGTFGNATRKRTFRRILRATEKSSSFKARIWTWRTGQFHAKALLWRIGDGAVAWLGSANLTDGGFSNEGEIMLELRAPWTSSSIRSIRSAFEREWLRGEPITREFVRSYRESRRRPPDMYVARRMRPSKRGRETTRLFTFSFDRHLPAGSPVRRRIERKLGGIDDAFVKHASKTVGGAREGDRCLVVDLMKKSAVMGKITAVCRDGRGWATAYVPDGAPIKWNRGTQARLSQAGLPITDKNGVRAGHVDDQTRDPIERAFAAARRT